MATTEKMLGKKHRRQCDCNIPQYVSGIDEKCNKVHGHSRARAREKKSWKAETSQYS